jgi:hypothetical protein
LVCYLALIFYLAWFDQTKPLVWYLSWFAMHVESVLNERNFKLEKKVALTTSLIKELDSTIEEVEFW